MMLGGNHQENISSSYPYSPVTSCCGGNPLNKHNPHIDCLAKEIPEDPKPVSPRVYLVLLSPPFLQALKETCSV